MQKMHAPLLTNKVEMHAFSFILAICLLILESPVYEKSNQE